MKSIDNYDIQALFDDIKKEEVSNVETFFKTDNERYEYVLARTDSGSKIEYAMIANFPLFSEHTIQSSTISKIIAETISIVHYLAISILFIVLLLIPIYVIEKKK